MMGALTGCSDDACERLCTDVTPAIATCLTDWEASWETLEVDDRSTFRQTCLDQWQQVRSKLEVRQIEAAEDQCQVTLDVLDDLSCEELRALYLPP